MNSSLELTDTLPYQETGVVTNLIRFSDAIIESPNATDSSNNHPRSPRPKAVSSVKINKCPGPPKVVAKLYGL